MVAVEGLVCLVVCQAEMSHMKICFWGSTPLQNKIKKTENDGFKYTYHFPEGPFLGAMLVPRRVSVCWAR